MLLYLQWSAIHNGMVMSCDFSHSGQLVVSASDIDNTIRIWDSKSGCLVQELKGILQTSFHGITLVGVQCTSDS